MEWLSDPGIWISLLTLTLLEIVLGIDNIIFISILSGKLPAGDRDRARKTGLVLAMLMRIGLLFGLAGLMKLDQTALFEVFRHAFTGKDLILILGGLFLLGKSTYEIHEKLEGEDGGASNAIKAPTFAAVIVQILVVDMVFSVDSVITAVGMVEHVPVMIAAVVISVGIMLISARAISDFINARPTLKILALSFLILIGAMLVAEGFGRHIPKGYIYFAMAFSVAVEFLNLKIRAQKSGDKVRLHQPYR